MKTTHASLLLALAAAWPAAYAQTGKWPDKPVRVIVPFPSGGVVDILARLVAVRLSEEFREQFIVDNRGGAGGSIGAEIAARANPDGYTVIVVATSYATNAALYKLPYDPVTGIAPVSLIATGPLIVTVNPSVKANSLKEFIDLARAKPRALNIGLQGTGSAGHLAVALFQQMTQTELIQVPYKGDAPAIIDLIGGHIQVYFGGPPAVSPHVNAGKLRALAVTSEQRSPVMPELPAVSEQVPGYAVPMWYGMWAPSGTPREIVTQLNQAIARFHKRPDVRERLRNDGMEAAYNTPEEFSRLIAQDIAKWTKVVKTGNIKVD